MPASKLPLNFILLYQGRTGSSFLIRALDQHPEIRAHGEILNWLGRLVVPGEQLSLPRRLAATAVRFVRGEPGKRQLRAVRDLYDDPRRPARVVGLKTKLREVRDPEGLRALLEERGVSVIVMDRANVIKKTVAHVYAQRLYRNTRHEHGDHAWNLFDEKDRLPSQHVPPEEFARWLEKVERTRAALRAYTETLRTPKLELEYDDLLRDAVAWFASIFDFLGVEHRDLASPTLRNEPADLRDALTNFDELRERYRGTPYEAMFDEIL